MVEISTMSDMSTYKSNALNSICECKLAIIAQLARQPFVFNSGYLSGNGCLFRARAQWTSNYSKSRAIDSIMINQSMCGVFAEQIGDREY